VPNPLQVNDGDVALRYLSGVGPYANRVAHPMPCLALVDLKLPKVSGFDLLKWIRLLASIPACCRLVVVDREVDVHTAARCAERISRNRQPSMACALVAGVAFCSLAQTPRLYAVLQPSHWEP
jgi:hypothetical protein